MPSFEEYKDRIESVEYASQKLIKAENYFNRFGLDLIVKRIDNDVFMVLTTDEEFRRIINFSEFNVRDVDIEQYLYKFYRDSQDLLERYERESYEPAVRVTVHSEDEINLSINGHSIDVGKGQELIITEPEGS
jgi:hypothetical protein